MSESIHVYIGSSGEGNASQKFNTLANGSCNMFSDLCVVSIVFNNG